MDFRQLHLARYGLFLLLTLLLIIPGMASAIQFSFTEPSTSERAIQLFDFSVGIMSVARLHTFESEEGTSFDAIALPALSVIQHADSDSEADAWPNLPQEESEYVLMETKLVDGMPMRMAGPGDASPAAVPEPTSLILLGTGLLGLFTYPQGRRQQNN